MKYENKNDNLRKLQLVELDGLKYLDKICKENNIEYYLAFGTLLGAVRHKGFIPWDDDIDIAMTGENYLKLLEVMKKNENKKYFFQTLETEKNYYLMWSKLRINNTLFAKEEQLANKINHGIFVDVFPLFEYPDKKDYKRITRKIKMIKLMIENNMTYNYQKKHYGKIGNILSKIIGIIPQKIRNNYVEKDKKKTPIEELKSLDLKVKKPALIFAYVYGILGTLILGTGMCFAMDVFALGSSVWIALGVVIGIMGIIMVSTNYPIFQHVLNKRKAKYSSEILAISNEILNHK